MASFDEDTCEDDVSLSNFCRKMNVLRNEGYRHDVVIQGQGNEEIFAHAIVLTTRFIHLKDVLQDPPLNNITRLVWPQFPTSVIQCIVSYAYTGSLQLTVENALQVFLIANNLRATTLRNACLEYLHPKLTLEALEKTWHVAVQTSSEELKDTCLNCMNDNFASIMSMPILRNFQFSSLMSLLWRHQDDSQTGEEHKFLLISSWIEADMRNRVDHVSDLLATISVNPLTHCFITDQLAADSGLVDCPAVRKWMTSALNHVQPLSISKSSALDGIFGTGWNDGKEDQLKIIHFDPRTNAQSNIGRLLHRQRSSLASLENSLFLIGGGNPAIAEVAAFDVVEKRRRNVPRMLEARQFHAVASSTRAILVCGGQGRRGGGGGGQTLSSCELFQPSERRWIPMPPMETMREVFQVVWLADGRIFAIGGWSGEGKLNSVETLHRDWAFDGETTDQWRRCSPMLEARSSFAAVVLQGDVVLVAGGYFSPTVELFAPPPAAGGSRALGQWTSLPSMQSNPESSCTGAFSDGVVFIFERDSTKIRRFRPSRRNANPLELTYWVWDEELSLTEVNSFILSATFK